MCRAASWWAYFPARRALTTQRRRQDARSRPRASARVYANIHKCLGGQGSAGARAPRRSSVIGPGAVRGRPRCWTVKCGDERWVRQAIVGAGEGLPRRPNACFGAIALLLCSSPHVDARTPSGQRSSAALQQVAEDGKLWGVALAELVSASRKAVLMSGTPYREDRRSIPGVVYDELDRGCFDFHYSYEDALTDGHVIPVRFPLQGGSASLRRKLRGDCSLSRTVRAGTW